MILLLLLLLLMTGAVDVVAEVACYHCYGNSSEQGQFCSINHLCLGQSCKSTKISQGGSLFHFITLKFLSSEATILLDDISQVWLCS
uniref:Secreted protein n=1 Tax=Angiostrongylus cantonensis TaxID=6313 RepID=A0A0K0DNU7_ANGCA